MNINSNNKLIPTLTSVGSRRAGSNDDSQADKVGNESTLASRSASFLHQALQKIKASSPLSSSLQTVKDKAGQLRQRLEILRSMIASATPAQAKALAKQLQDVAKQLGTLATELKQSGGDSGVATPSLAAASREVGQVEAQARGNVGSADPAAASDSSPADRDTQAAAQAAANAAASNNGDDGKVDGKDAPAKDSTAQSTDKTPANGSNDGQSQHLDERAKRNGQSEAHGLLLNLLDLRKMLKAAWQELKPKLDSNDPAVRSVEGQLRETDQQLAEISDTTYDVAGSINIDNGSADSGNAGTSISVTA